MSKLARKMKRKQPEFVGAKRKVREYRKFYREVVAHPAVDGLNKK